MNQIINPIVEVVSMVIGVAILAVIVGTNSQTSNVITSAGSALSSILKAAMAPVTSGSTSEFSGF